MAKFFGNLNAVLAAGVVLMLVVLFGVQGVYDNNYMWRWAHVICGIMWIGHLYYFNFTQIPTMPKIPAELKPAVSKHIAPVALFWFRWSALATWVMGVALAGSKHVLIPAYTLGASEGFASKSNILLGVGMWLATIMFLNVWVFIWPNQKIALGIVEGITERDLVASPIETAFRDGLRVRMRAMP